MAAFAGGNLSIAGSSQLRLVGSARTAQGQQSSRIHLFDIVTPGSLHDPHGIIHSGATHGHGSPTGNDLIRHRILGGDPALLATNPSQSSAMGNRKLASCHTPAFAGLRRSNSD